MSSAEDGVVCEITSAEWSLCRKIDDFGHRFARVSASDFFILFTVISIFRILFFDLYAKYFDAVNCLEFYGLEESFCCFVFIFV